MTYEGETVSADNPEVTWDSVIDEVIPATSKVSKGGDTLRMPSIINLQEYGLIISPRIAAQKSILLRSVLTTIFCFKAMLTSPKLTIKSALTTAQSAAHQFKAVNKNFDNTCNDMFYHVLQFPKNPTNHTHSKRCYRKMIGINL